MNELNDVSLIIIAIQLPLICLLPHLDCQPAAIPSSSPYSSSRPSLLRCHVCLHSHAKQMYTHIRQKAACHIRPEYNFLLLNAVANCHTTPSFLCCHLTLPMGQMPCHHQRRRRGVLCRKSQGNGQRRRRRRDDKKSVPRRFSLISQSPCASWLMH